MTSGEVLHKLWVGLKLRCPHCEQGRTFRGLFGVQHVCENCGLRFEKDDGESVGGMYINFVLAELMTVGGFFGVNALLKPPWVINLTFWVIWNIGFVLLFYRHSRSLWMAVSYMTGGSDHTFIRDENDNP